MGTEIISLSVGPERKQYSVHKSLLTTQSDYFDKALNGGFREAGENSIHLEEDDPAAIALLVGWLYRGVIPAAATKSIHAPGAFPPTDIASVLLKGGTGVRVPNHIETELFASYVFQSILTHPRYFKYSSEELRLADYSEGRTSNSAPELIEEDIEQDQVLSGSPNPGPTLGTLSTPNNVSSGPRIFPLSSATPMGSVGALQVVGNPWDQSRQITRSAQSAATIPSGGFQFGNTRLTSAPTSSSLFGGAISPSALSSGVSGADSGRSSASTVFAQNSRIPLGTTFQQNISTATTHNHGQHESAPNSHFEQPDHISIIPGHRNDTDQTLFGSLPLMGRPASLSSQIFSIPAQVSDPIDISPQQALLPQDPLLESENQLNKTVSQTSSHPPSTNLAVSASSSTPRHFLSVSAESPSHPGPMESKAPASTAENASGTSRLGETANLAPLQRERSTQRPISTEASDTSTSPNQSVSSEVAREGSQNSYFVPAAAEIAPFGDSSSSVFGPSLAFGATPTTSIFNPLQKRPDITTPWSSRSTVAPSPFGFTSGQSVSFSSQSTQQPFVGNIAPPESVVFYNTDSEHQTALLHLTIFAETTCWPILYNAAITSYIAGERRLSRPPPMEHIVLIYERTHDESSLRTWAVDTLSSCKREVDMSGYMSLLVDYPDFLKGVLMKLREKGKDASDQERGFDGAGGLKYRMMEHGKKDIFGKGKVRADDW